MNETRFRALMRDALGEEPMRPWLSQAVRTRLAQPQRARTFPARWLVLAAACLVVAVTAVAVAPLVLHRSAVQVAPAASPGASATPSITALKCTLPVIVGAGVPGYINTATGQFTRDEQGSQGLPGGAGARGYDTVLGRWLPVPVSWTSPDGLAYAYTIQDSAASFELHVYRLNTGTDTLELTDSGGIFIRGWMNDGIHFDTDHEIAGTQHLFDPTTGKQTAIPATDDRFTPLAGDPIGTDGTGFHAIGHTAAGQPIFWFFNLDKTAAVDWVFYETAPGVRVYIYKGTMGDATSFAPGAALADSHGIWFSDYHARSQVWHWDPTNGLRSIQTQVPGGIDAVPAGGCF